ncbi:MAG: hypothetical protein ACTSPW_00795 [Promethearchaeota archaeon]
MKIEEIIEKIKDFFSIDNIVENLTSIAIVAGGLIALDKIIDISSKLEPIYKRVKDLNERGNLMETIDTIGDNIELIRLGLKALNIEVEKSKMDKIADFLQSVSMAGKYFEKIFDTLKERRYNNGSRVKLLTSKYKG